MFIIDTIIFAAIFVTTCWLVSKFLDWCFSWNDDAVEVE
jgi:hypothetical protein